MQNFHAQFSCREQLSFHKKAKMVQGLSHVNAVLLMESLKTKPDRNKNEQVGKQKRTKKMCCFNLITVINNLSFLSFDF